MTLVEFLDTKPVENLSGALTVDTDKIIFIGQAKQIEKTKWELENILDYRDFVGSIEYISVNPNDTDDTMGKIIDTIAKNPGCIFDITGGDGLILFAFGRVYERYSSRDMNLHLMNVRTGRERFISDDEHSYQNRPVLSVEENIMLHGGLVVYDDMKRGGTHAWAYDDEFVADIEKMWEICRQDVGLWNYQTTLLEEIEQMNEAPADEPLLLEVNSEDIFSNASTYPNLTGIFPLLLESGILTDYHFDRNFFRIQYKNEQVKRCLIKAGTILELKTYVLASRLCYKNGNHVFDNGMVGVYIDWDGQVHYGWDEADTENEVDVVMMKGLVPVFISCKNGSFKVDELYKLSSVADYFGKGYAKKILVCSDENKLEGSKEHLYDRASAMGIQIITNVASMTDAAFGKLLINAST